jgi:A/G-specific adenine glycosylase
LNDFATRLLRWFDEHGRKDLPWQRDISPYRVWISEIMLQQTQVQTVIPYYERFMQSFPDLQALAQARLDAVLQHWSGLGYYARARNLHKAAQQLRDEHDGVFPSDFADVVALPGIGRSTAAAILSIASEQRHAILDGNVKRVLARHAAIAGWPGRTEVARQLWERAEACTPRARVADYTQAIMDLGATVCTRSKPACDRCPVATDCAARLADAVAEYPGRKPKKARPLRATTMVIAVDEARIFLERRPAAGIWGGLWSLPEVADVEDWCCNTLGQKPHSTASLEVMRHSFSHFDLDIQPVVVRVNAAQSKVADSADTTWYRLDDEPPGGMAAPVQQILQSLQTERDVPNH